MLGLPVEGAQVRVWRLDLDGERRDRKPVAEAVTDAAGRFRMELGATFSNLQIESTGGRVHELWADELLEVDPAVPLVAVIPLYEPLPPREIVVSPFTSVATALAERQHANQDEARYHEVTRRVQADFGQHFGGISILDTPPAPISEPISQLTPDVRHGLLLASLSLLVGRMAEVSAGSPRSFNTQALTAALMADASSEEALLDGIGPQGQLALGICAPEPDCAECRPLCQLGTETLRQDLAETLAFHLIGSIHDGTGLAFGDGAAFADQIAQGAAAALFGDVEGGGIRDEKGPSITALESPYFDESQDVIAFDAELRPVHVHSAGARVDLSSVFEGSCERTLHKHVNLLGTEDNPLRWRFAVSDEAAGFETRDVSVRVRPPGVTAPRQLEVVPAEQPDGASPLGRVFEVVASEAEVSALADVEGRFDIEITARDRLGNPSEVMRGCWQHIPRAAPLHAGQLEEETGPGSLASLNLDNDDIALLFGDPRPASLGFPLVSVPLENNTDETIYLTLSLDQLEGTFSRTWLESRAFLRSDIQARDCLNGNPPTCSLTLDREPTEDAVSGQPLPSVQERYFVLRVIDAQNGVPLVCDECRAGEFRLDANRSYAIQVVATSLNFLVPDDIEPGAVQRILVGPSGEKVALTGEIQIGSFHHCSEPSQGLCVSNSFYDFYHALTYAEINIETLHLVASTAPIQALTPRRTQPPNAANESTLAAPILTSYAWSSREESIPPIDSD
ncbi:hypothetical protein [Haliangium ochraceum]|uniref:Uncharacterized protein n=1 Tax=Haliangium ochraceum (strain DSM 14365 / JCM 11303 / SMP-2) TaxID=502025 RepID=D0LND6_HALO1|nr:hypothetical protein [Haliangium ochraceum]ACY15313.1 hypothetical protein Hoch_2786 [Haliangium ochraceum DSM 14365]